jgi:hypothetical protein
MLDTEFYECVFGCHHCGEPVMRRIDAAVAINELLDAMPPRAPGLKHGVETVPYRVDDFVAHVLQLREGLRSIVLELDGVHLRCEAIARAGGQVMHPAMAPRAPRALQS